MTLDHGSTRRARSVRAGVLSAAALTLALGALPMAVTNSAQATHPAQRDRQGKCDVEANEPTAAPRGRVNYSFEFECPKGYRVQVEQKMYEADDRRDQFTSGPYRYQHRFGGDREWEESTRVALPNTERGDEEVYHVVRWREYEKNGDASRWYTKKSDTTTIRQRR